MAQAVPNPPPGFEQLSVDEKIEYVESLWEQIVGSSSVPVPDWHLQLLEERLAAYRAAPAEGTAWSEVRAELERKWCGRC